MEGPGLRRGPIPSEILTIYDKPITVTEPLQPIPDLVSIGKEHFTKLGCANCHDDNKKEMINSYPEMAKLRSGHGCLSNDKNVPRYDLNESQRNLITSTLEAKEATKLTDKQKIQKTLVQFNCIACHDRAGLSSIAPERNGYFTGSKPELGNQGRIPPPRIWKVADMPSV